MKSLVCINADYMDIEIRQASFNFWKGVYFC